MITIEDHIVMVKIGPILRKALCFFSDYRKILAYYGMNAAFERRFETHSAKVDFPEDSGPVNAMRIDIFFVTLQRCHNLQD